MNPKLAQHALLRRGITTVLLGVVSALLMIVVSWFKLHYQQVALTEQEQTLRSAQAQRDKAERAVRIVKDDLPLFKQLENNGVIGEEKRLLWLQTLVQSGEKLRLSSMQYKIGTQEVFAPDFVNFGGNYEIRRSDMIIITQSLHEADILQVIDNLAREPSGLFQVSECEMQRLQKEINPQMELPNVMAECRLRWFTVHHATSSTAPG